MAELTKEIRLGVNREKPRLWLEGVWLHNLGFVAKSTHVNVSITAEEIRIEASADGSRRVSGKGERPIIDIVGDQLNAYAGRPLVLIGSKGLIIVRRK